MNLNVIIPLATIVVFAILGMPIWLALVAGTIPYFLILQPTLPTQIIIQRFVSTMESSSYLAIPLFITAGVIMNYSGISKRLMGLADALVGHISGGLGHVNVMLSVLMGGISGSAAADAATECKILVPEMAKRGYNREFSGAVTIASSLLTPIIPPGMGLIIYAFVTGTSVGRMFAAGYVPGLLGMIFMMIYVYFVSRKRGYKGSREHMAPLKEIGKLSLKAIWALLLPFGLIFALRIGLVTATEAGAMCALYAAIVGALIYREIKWKHVWPIIKESLLGTAVVMILICSAAPLAYFITYESIPQQLASAIIGMGLNKYTFLLIVNVVLLFIGMFMDGGAPLIILAPLLAPIAISMGVDPVAFGIMMVFNIGIGNMSPPFGIVLYQVRGLLGLKMGRLVRECLPFIGIMLLVLAIITLLPDLVLLIPNLIYGG